MISFLIALGTCTHKSHKMSSSSRVFAFALTIQSRRALNPCSCLIIDFQAKLNVNKVFRENMEILPLNHGEQYCDHAGI